MFYMGSKEKRPQREYHSNKGGCDEEPPEPVLHWGGITFRGHHVCTSMDRRQVDERPDSIAPAPPDESFYSSGVTTPSGAFVVDSEPTPPSS